MSYELQKLLEQIHHFLKARSCKHFHQVLTFDNIEVQCLFCPTDTSVLVVLIVRAGQRIGGLRDKTQSDELDSHQFFIKKKLFMITALEVHPVHIFVHF